MFRIGAKLLFSSLKFALQVIFDDELDKKIKTNRKKRNSYDEYVRAATKR